VKASVIVSNSEFYIPLSHIIAKIKRDFIKLHIS